MSDLRQKLETLLKGRVVIVGLGNPAYGDDGFGVSLAQCLAEKGLSDVVMAGNAPERFIGRIADENFDTVLFLDAVEFGAAPGSAVLLNSEEMTAKFPQISTHKISLGLLSKWVEANGRTKAWLLGVQPESLKVDTRLTPTTQTTLNVLADLLSELLAAKQRTAALVQRNEVMHV